MTTTASGSVRDELTFLLHPADDRDVPVPGFPTHDALVAWARSRPADELIEAAVQVLQHDGWPQQYAAMALLRALGADVEGVGYDDDFRWRLIKPGGRRARFIEPSVKERTRPVESLGAGSGVGKVDQARAVIANAINRIGQRERLILTLCYYEKLPDHAVAEVLDIDGETVRRLREKALRALRGSISDPEWERLEQLASEAPLDSEAVGAFALIRGLAAA